MKNSLLMVALWLSGITVFAQNSFKITVQDSTTKEKLIGVSIKIDKTTNGTLSDISGNAELKKVPNGEQTFLISYVGYKTLSKTIKFPLKNPDQVFMFSLESEAGDLEEVTVTSTRTNSGIESLAMKVEVLGLDDMNEENTIKPANIGSILGDLSVIQIQQTSAINGNSVVRMQGLDGKYTQLLRDGLPLYEGFSGSFGIMQIPPLDLKQIEIIKGSVSTLYGGGAISGMINLISKVPTDSSQFTLTLNRSTLKESNVNAYFSKKLGKIGVTLFVGNTYQDAVDVNKDGISDVTEVKSTLVHPKIFFYLGDNTKLNVGYSTLFETRLGGDMEVINFKPTLQHSFYQKNITSRNSFDANFRQDFSKNKNLSIKGTVSFFNRSIQQSDSTGTGNFLFQGKQVSAFSEASYFVKKGSNEVVAGINFTNESFKKGTTDYSLLTNYTYQTFGIFAQDSWHLTDFFTLEAGLRTDFHNVYGSFILPRLAFLYHPKANFSVRLSGGQGYKTPNIFTQQTLSGSFQNLIPISSEVKAEKSTGVNCDINYKVNLGEITMQLNQAFYYTKILNPITTEIFDVYAPSSPTNYPGIVFHMIGLTNANYNVNSLGTDTYLRFTYNEVELYVGYNHTVAKQVDNGHNTFLAFSPHDKFASTLVYEIPQKWRFGIENSWIGNQYITNISDITGSTAGKTKVPNYWFFAMMIERKFRNVSFVLNCENLFDYRQSRIESLFLGSITNPTFKPIWAPLDGRVLNLSMKISI